MTEKKPCRVCTQFKSVAGINTHLPKKDAPTKKEENAVTVPYSPFPCPPDSTELGRSTWTFLHTMAAYYPESPTIEQRAGMRSFLRHFSRFYPCGYCASHLQEYTQRHPPNVDSNVALSQWMCQVHNEVNEMLGKDEFDCSRVFERWRDASPGSNC